MNVFINGVFDIIHAGHIRLIREAQEQGDYLLIAIDSDERVKRLKGHSRPINTAEKRKVVLDAIKGVDAVWTFDSDEELLRIIRIFNPQVMVKGADYRNKPIIGADLVPKIHFVELTDDSTTKIIQSIGNR